MTELRDQASGLSAACSCPPAINVACCMMRWQAMRLGMHTVINQCRPASTLTQGSSMWGRSFHTMQHHYTHLGKKVGWLSVQNDVGRVQGRRGPLVVRGQRISGVVRQRTEAKLGPISTQDLTNACRVEHGIMRALAAGSGCKSEAGRACNYRG